MLLVRSGEILHRTGSECKCVDLMGISGSFRVDWSSRYDEVMTDEFQSGSQ